MSLYVDTALMRAQQLDQKLKAVSLRPIEHLVWILDAVYRHEI